jgi:hypothetical protein
MAVTAREAAVVEALAEAANLSNKLANRKAVAVPKASHKEQRPRQWDQHPSQGQPQLLYQMQALYFQQLPHLATLR